MALKSELRGKVGVYQHQVHYYETDKMGVTHHSNYIRWMEETRVEFLDMIGWGYDKLEQLGIGSPVIGIECNYLHSTDFHDIVTIEASLVEFKGVRYAVRYKMLNEEGVVVAEGRSRHCFMGADGRPIRLKRDFPEFYEAFTSYIVEEGEDA